MRTILVATFVSICSAAQAFTTWVTPFGFVGPGDEAWCVVTNLDKKATFTNVQLIDASGLEITQVLAGCTDTLTPGFTCVNAATITASAQCNVVTGTSKVRVALEIVDGSGHPRVLVPATK